MVNKKQDASFTNKTGVCRKTNQEFKIGRLLKNSNVYTILLDGERLFLRLESVSRKTRKEEEFYDKVKQDFAGSPIKLFPEIIYHGEVVIDNNTVLYGFITREELRPMMEKRLSDKHIHNLLSILEYLNRLGIHHGQISPENIMFGSKDGEVYLTNFFSKREQTIFTSDGKAGIVSDLESLSFVILHSLFSTLPWQNVDNLSLSKNIKRRFIQDYKSYLASVGLLDKTPTNVIQLLSMLQRLREETVDRGDLDNILNSLRSNFKVGGSKITERPRVSMGRRI